MTTTTDTTTASEAQAVAAVIRRQITVGVLMSLGAHDLAYSTDQRGALTFKARIIRKGQTRVRIMRVTVTLTDRDTYNIQVGYMQKFDWVSYVDLTDVYADSLARVLLDLDDVL